MLNLPTNHQNALLLCARYVTPKCIKELLAKFNLDFDIADLHGNGVLHLIMMREYGEADKIKVLKLFYDNGNWHGMSLNAQNDQGQTVLDLVKIDEIELEFYLTQCDAKRSAQLTIKAPITPTFAHYTSSPSSFSVMSMETTDTCLEIGMGIKRRYPV